MLIGRWEGTSDGHSGTGTVRRMSYNVRRLMMTIATITCPACGVATAETMPADACQFFYECPACHEVLRPKAGDCCVFCSYADQRCPPMQESGNGLRPNSAE